MSHKATLQNQTKVVTVTVFDNEEKNNAAVGGAVSFLPPVLQTPRHISSRKTVSVTGKEL